MFRDTQAYPRIIQAYSEFCVTLAYSETWYIQNPCLFRTRNIIRSLLYLEISIFRTRGILRAQVYSKLWHIQKPFIFRTVVYSEVKVYSDSCYIQNHGILKIMQIFRSWGILRTLVYSEPETCSELEAFLEFWHIENQRFIQNPVKNLWWSVLQK